MGLAKSGTTAISALLAQRTGNTVLLDTPHFWFPNNIRLFNKQVQLKQHLIKHSEILNYKILKEPNFTLLFDQFQQLFPSSKFVFIVRNPWDNIRSILNRVNIEGNLLHLNDKETIPPGWKSVFNDSFSDKEHYIDKLAEYWVINTDIYVENKESFILVKYEDFVNNKLNYIDELVKKLELKNPRLPLDVNTQYQPKGESYIDINQFFETNIQKIDRICLPNYHAIFKV
ncbi:Sulfotransferase domain protein [Salinivirga cyanobacteriivorans]|uniref:Sulfotransferase domain protein n=1 Tax=Salinivirga cyanobacteriivorans TaxID=1307839 RepID=A0A0S2I005_9BACT|nr:sulfotransferase [Salinivirga cyanobacteriivorans]ALO15611.1 Sulfotransferase domain protein [Salinivirga cyanobacteriivorans]